MTYPENKQLLCDIKVTSNVDINKLNKDIIKILSNPKFKNISSCKSINKSDLSIVELLSTPNAMHNQDSLKIDSKDVLVSKAMQCLSDILNSDKVSESTKQGKEVFENHKIFIVLKMSLIINLNNYY